MSWLALPEAQLTNNPEAIGRGVVLRAFKAGDRTYPRGMTVGATEILAWRNWRAMAQSGFIELLLATPTKEMNE